MTEPTNGKYVTNRELYDRLTAMEEKWNDRWIKVWIGLAALGAVNGGALIRGFGGPAPAITWVVSLFS